MAFHDRTQAATAGRMRRMVDAVASGILAWREECATRDALGKLSDHELYDIGLARGDFDQMRSSGPRNG